MKDSKAVKLIALAYEEGHSEGYGHGYAEASNAHDERTKLAYEKGRREALSDEASAQAKSRAYEEGYAKAQEEAHKVGYQRGLAEGQARGSGSENSYNSGLEAGVKAERERALAAEPKLSVWFKPCGKNKFEMQNGAPVLIPQSYNPVKIEGIRAIREAYGSGEGYSLRDVKDMVETEPGCGDLMSCGQPLPQSKAVTLYLQLQAAGFDPSLRA